MNLGLFKTKKEGAKKGYDLLKNKADALKVSESFNFFLNKITLFLLLYL
jgi:vacuolar-type H+-ATPase subunit D/Vma8